MQPGREASVLYVRVLLADGADPDRVAQVVVARVASLWAREATARETFAQLKSISETERLLDEPGQLPHALERAMNAALGPQPPPSPTMGPALTSQSMARFAYEWLTRDKAHVTLFTPAPPAMGTARETPVAAHHSPPAAEPSSELVPGAAGWSAPELRALVPASPAIVVKTISSGLTVVTVRRPGAAVVAWLGFRGGSADAEPPLLAEMALRARPEARQAIRLNILPARGATKDLTFDTVEFRPAQLPDALTILFAKATSPLPAWPDHDGLERLVSPIAAAEDAPTRKGAQAFWRALFGDHPYARVVSADDLDKLTRSDVEAWMGRVENVHNAALIVIGDVSAAEVEREALDSLAADEGLDLGRQSPGARRARRPPAQRRAAAGGDHAAPGRAHRRSSGLPAAGADRGRPRVLRASVARDRGAVEHGAADRSGGRVRRQGRL